MLLQFRRTARAPAMPQRFLSSTTFRQSCYPLIPRLPSMEWLLMPVLATVPARQAWGSSCRRLWLCTCVMCLEANLRHDCRWPWQAWVLVVYWRDRAVALQLVLPCMGGRHRFASSARTCSCSVQLCGSGTLGKVSRHVMGPLLSSTCPCPQVTWVATTAVTGAPQARQ